MDGTNPYSGPSTRLGLRLRKPRSTSPTVLSPMTSAFLFNSGVSELSNKVSDCHDRNSDDATNTMVISANRRRLTMGVKRFSATNAGTFSLAIFAAYAFVIPLVAAETSIWVIASSIVRVTEPSFVLKSSTS
jgi:hypothetical protein